MENLLPIVGIVLGIVVFIIMIFTQLRTRPGRNLAGIIALLALALALISALTIVFK